MNYLIYLIQSASFIYFSYLSGRLIFRLLKFDSESKISALVYPLMLGYGLIGNFGLILAVFGLFKAFYFYLFIIFVLILSRRDLISHFHEITDLIKQKQKIKIWLRQLIKDNLILKIIIFFWVIFYILISFMPSSMGSDGLAYHLPSAFEIIEKNKIYFPLLGSLFYGYMPLIVEIFYAAPILIFKNIIVFKVLQFSVSLLLLLLVTDFTGKFIKNKILNFLIIVGFLALMPFQTVALAGGFIDVFTFLYGLASFFILIDIFLDKTNPAADNKNLLLSAIFLGLALSTKYGGLSFAATNGLVLLLIILKKKKSFIKTIALYAAPVFIISGFWYLKNYIYTGNPLYPIAFGTNDMMSQSLGYYTVMDRKFINFFIFPFLLFGKNTVLKLPFAFYNALSFCFMYLAGLFLIFKKNLGKLELVLFGFVQIYLLILFYWTHQIRFAAPALIILIVLNAVMLDKIILRLTKRKVIFGLVSIIAAILLAASINALKAQTACLIGKNDQNSCLAYTTGGTIYAIDYANRNLTNQVILDYWNPFGAYYLKNGNSYTNTLCAGYNYNDDGIRNCLTANHIKYLIDLIGSNNSYSQNPEINNANIKIAITRYIIKNSRLIYDYYDKPMRISVKLYELK